MMHSLNKKAPKGQGFVEYALILFLVVAVVIVTIFWLGPAIGNMYSNITTSISVLPSYP
jgi:Flp pilus assembly pilin Flp